MSEKEKKRTVLEIDPDKLHEGTCRIEKTKTGERWAVCKEKGKIKIYPIEEEE